MIDRTKLQTALALYFRSQHHTDQVFLGDEPHPIDSSEAVEYFNAKASTWVDVIMAFDEAESEECLDECACCAVPHGEGHLGWHVYIDSAGRRYRYCMHCKSDAPDLRPRARRVRAAKRATPKDSKDREKN